MSEYQNRKLESKVLLEANEYKISRSNIEFLVSLVTSNTKNDLVKELLEVYSEILEKDKNDSFSTDEYIVKGKPHLYEFLLKGGFIATKNQVNQEQTNLAIIPESEEGVDHFMKQLNYDKESFIGERLGIDEDYFNRRRVIKKRNAVIINITLLISLGMNIVQSYSNDCLKKQNELLYQYTTELEKNRDIQYSNGYNDAIREIIKLLEMGNSMSDLVYRTYQEPVSITTNEYKKNKEVINEFLGISENKGDLQEPIQKVKKINNNI